MAIGTARMFVWVVYLLFGCRAANISRCWTRFMKDDFPVIAFPKLVRKLPPSSGVNKREVPADDPSRLCWWRLTILPSLCTPYRTWTIDGIQKKKSAKNKNNKYLFSIYLFICFLWFSLTSSLQHVLRWVWTSCQHGGESMVHQFWTREKLSAWHFRIRSSR